MCLGLEILSFSSIKHKFTVLSLIGDTDGTIHITRYEQSTHEHNLSIFQRFFSIQIRVRVFVVYSSSIVHFIQYFCVYYQGRLISSQYPWVINYFPSLFSPFFLRWNFMELFRYIYIFFWFISYTHIPNTRRKTFLNRTNLRQIPMHLQRIQGTPNAVPTFTKTKKRPNLWGLSTQQTVLHRVFSNRHILTKSFKDQVTHDPWKGVLMKVFKYVQLMRESQVVNYKMRGTERNRWKDILWISTINFINRLWFDRSTRMTY